MIFSDFKIGQKLPNVTRFGNLVTNRVITNITSDINDHLTIKINYDYNGKNINGNLTNLPIHKNTKVELINGFIDIL